MVVMCSSCAAIASLDCKDEVDFGETTTTNRDAAGVDSAVLSDADLGDGNASPDVAADGNTSPGDAGGVADGEVDAGPPPCGSLRIPTGGGAVVNGSQSVLPAGNACFEAWTRLDGSKQSPAYLSVCSAGDNCNAILSIRNDLSQVGFHVQSSGQVAVRAVANIGNGGLAPQDDQWHHIAGCREIDGAAVNLKLFWDGQIVAMASGSTNSLPPPVSDLRLGSMEYATSDGLGGYLDEVRVSSTLRYVGAFTPERRFIADARTAVLLHFDSVTSRFVDSSMNALSGSLLGTASGANVCPAP